jgi:hypothetical protein
MTTKTRDKTQRNQTITTQARDKDKKNMHRKNICEFGRAKELPFDDENV